MSTDFSVAPEIAQLAAPLVDLLPGPPPAAPPAPVTAGRLAAELTRLAACPQAWWDLVRFDPSSVVRVPVPGAPGAWLLVIPPGGLTRCDCRYATVVAGEATEDGRPLRPGRVLVHGAGAGPDGGGGHGVRGSAHGYAVSLHFLCRTDRH